MNPKILKLLKFWLPVVAWAGVIFAFSSNPAKGTGEIIWSDFIIKKSAHIFVFAVLTTFIYRALINYNFGTKLSVKYGFIASFLYSFTDEFHQSFIPGRFPSLKDIIFDTFGILLALYFVTTYLPKAVKVIKLWAERFDLYTTKK